MFKKDSQQSTVDNYSLLSDSVQMDILSHEDMNMHTKKVELQGVLDNLKQKLQIEKSLNKNNKLMMLNKKLEKLINKSLFIKGIIQSKKEDYLIQLEQKNTQCCYKEYVLNFIEKEETELSNEIQKKQKRSNKKLNRKLLKIPQKGIHS